MAATSRRIAWPTLTIESCAIDSGSASRTATCAIDWEIMRSSWVRASMWARTKKNTTGAKKPAISPTSSGTAPPPWATRAAKAPS